MKKCIFNIILDCLSGPRGGFLSNLKLKTISSLGAKIHPEAFFDIGVRIRFLNNLYVSKGVSIGDGCKFMCFGDVVISEYAQFANDVMVVSGTHDTTTRLPISNCKVEIGKFCWIGAGVKIVGNVNIGEGCVIGAGSTVLGDMPSWSVCVGSPAKPVRRIIKPQKIFTGVGEVGIDD